ncbi:glycoside hydrolase/deacetylase [Trametes versicolor FP-101664 SS1]|uniref:glycoside hydrolase/deacetylase n=1 Tax=Trametes versicolor (strain FP-101664) TaxID=717944 RepID=UPI0004623E6B|nr:glycoside hydrolase/deacetylase [Trametes versicolor FP-101664 SS1]EIW64552.1 glycoside hydrolase/deacetylase [Trametes versicolor FP-101664 SS1]
MRFAAVSALAIPALVSAHGIRDAHHARQAPAANAASGSSASTSAAAASSTGSAPAASASTATAVAASGPAGASTLTFTLASTNPSAIPLTEIIANAPSQATVAATTTFAGGTTPTFLPSAPALPDISKLVPSNYPTLDVVPPTDSPEVQQWIKEVAASGVDIPNFAPTTADGSCASNAAAAADSTRCWWTCGGCKADDDIEECPDKMTWGLTYDDGPALYTGDLLHYLDSVNLKATFFVVGSRAISYPALLQNEYMAQHQIAVHTWSHHPMTTLTNEQIIAELGWSKKIIKDVLGVTPTYWRPPYGDVDNRVRAIAKAMGLQTSIWTRISPTATFDTGDFDINGGTITSEQVLNNWQSIIGNATVIDHGFIVLEHDLFQQTVDIATGYILPDALAHQPPFDIKPMVQCLNKPLSDAYIETNDNTTNPIGSANATGSATGSSAEATGGSNSSGAASGSNSAMGVASPGSMAAIALAVVSGAIALFL